MYLLVFHMEAFKFIFVEDFFSFRIRGISLLLNKHTYIYVHITTTHEVKCVQQIKINEACMIPEQRLSAHLFYLYAKDHAPLSINSTFPESMEFLSYIFKPSSPRVQ